MVEDDLSEKKLPQASVANLEFLKDVIIRHPKISESDICDLGIKICAIDTTNSTQLFKAKKKLSVSDLAEIIKQTPDIDERIKNGDMSVVEEISRSAKQKHGYNPFSFASKFCHYHNFFLYGKNDYSVYDSNVKNWLLKYYKDKDKTLSETIQKELWKHTFNYTAFNDCIQNVLNDMGLSEKENARMLFDKLVWVSEKYNNTGSS